MSTSRTSDLEKPGATGEPAAERGHALDVERDSDVPISTQIYWQLAYQIDSGRLLAGMRLRRARPRSQGRRRPSCAWPGRRTG